MVSSTYVNTIRPETAHRTETSYLQKSDQMQ